MKSRTDRNPESAGLKSRGTSLLSQGNAVPAGRAEDAQREGWTHGEKGGRAVLHGMRNSLNTLTGALTVLLTRYPSDAYLTEFLTVMEEEMRRLADLVGRVSYPGDSRDARPATDLKALMRSWEGVAAGGIRIPCMRFLYGAEPLPPVAVEAAPLGQMLMMAAAHLARVMDPESALFLRARLGWRSKQVHVVAEMGATGQDGVAVQLPGLRQCDFSFLRKALRQYGGRLAVNAAPGAAATVCIYFPAAERKE
ncbi:MAG: hypothetical protein M0024_08680 [Nitrospiraceae bacterium]|nr:hypothetical protein [Nitrospiraceae bacterium]